MVKSGRIAAVQSISGTGGCRLAGEFIHKFMGNRAIYVPNPTWGNHLAIFTNSGLKPSYYPYYDASKNAVDFASLMNFVNTVENNSVFLLHACAHNPTGCDLTRNQWDELSLVMKTKQHVVIMDSAYQVRYFSCPSYPLFLKIVVRASLVAIRKRMLMQYVDF